MNELLLKFKRLSQAAVIPTRANLWDAGLDLIATRVINDKLEQIIFGTDLAVEIPDGYVGLIFPRSSIRKTDYMLANSVGVIDSGYRGEIQVTFNRITFEYGEYSIGDKIAQLVVVPVLILNPTEVTELSSSDRGENGHGSSGK